MKTKIFGFALPFHLQKSHSHETLVAKPLSKWCNFTFKAWDGVNISYKYPKGILVFFQYPPPINIANNANYNVVWIPMWDHIKKYTDSFWTNIPKKVRVIAFSQAVSNVAKRYRLTTLNLQYYPDSSLGKHRNNKRDRALFYWNRTGLIGKEELAKICNVLQIDTLYFQNQLDPGLISTLDYKLGKKLGSTKVIHLPKYLPRKSYEEILDKVSVYIAPRAYEGAGISFIETLARGCFVLGHNAPTMNEYILHLKNGFLFSFKESNSFIDILIKAISIRMPKYLGGRDYTHHLDLNWQTLEKVNLNKIGNNAAKRAVQGYDNWIGNLKKYRDFITDW